METMLKAHPAAEIFPMIPALELRELAEDIKANGLIEPVAIYKNEILDGRNRYAACRMVDVEPTIVDITDSVVSPVLYVMSRNMHRRHLTVSQKAAIAAEMVPMLREEAKERQREHGRTAPGRSKTLPADTPEVKGDVRDIAAKAVGVGGKTVQLAMNVRNSNPDTFEKVKRGELTVNAAAAGHTEQPQHGGHVPKSLSSPRGQQIAENQKRRMGDGLGMVNGVCSGLDGLDVQLIASVCDEEEIQMWAEKAEQHARELRRFAAKLKGAKRDGESA